ncbi:MULTISPECIES: hypothetical protein [Flavobacterium]|uniref:Uncharacterized protein n=1 Tax=Flavobacterium lipolyticum TaxID=2893754 RepID=A0ABS8M122_9FLAO|nr:MULTISPECIES: hypothetical protein [Flavobacterium]MCC9018489.1 hypothetical protein [Flavobacterium sp. F-126]MDL2142459.1 hypothetical protein [Flavobacterium tructae]OXB23462.1 hypothetical protein B0A80_10995 [Flavobacterium tructae]
MKINKCMFLVVVLLLKTPTIACQNKINETDMVTNFVKSVFFEERSTRFIADNFICFETVNSDVKYSLDDRIEILSKHLKKIKEDKKVLLNSEDFYVVGYKDYKHDKVFFSRDTDKIFILISKNKPVEYFYLIDGRILSFDYILKGDEGVFITY